MGDKTAAQLAQATSILAGDLLVTWPIAGSGGPLQGIDAITALGLATPELYGAVGDGIVDDSAAFVAAISAKRNIICTPGSSYKLKNIDLSNSCSINGNNTLFNGASGAAYMFKLKDTAAALYNIYISDSTNCSEAAVVFDDGEDCVFLDSTIVNAVNCIKFKSSAGVLGTVCARAIVDNVNLNTWSGNGVDIETNVCQTTISNVRGMAGTIAGTGGNKPKTGAVGLRLNSAGGVAGNAIGGHIFANNDFEEMEKPYWFTAAQLVKVSGCIGDTCSGPALTIDGASDHVDVFDFFAGTSEGISVSGSSININIVAPRTLLTGVIPPGGATDFFISAAPYYDLSVGGTASVTISGDDWRGGKSNTVASGAFLTATGGTILESCSNAILAPGADYFLGPNGEKTPLANEVFSVWRAPYDGYLFAGTAFPATAAGAGQSFLYTARAAGADTGFVATAGAAAVSATFTGGPVQVSKNSAISVKLHPSAGAATVPHSVQLQFLPL